MQHYQEIALKYKSEFKPIHYVYDHKCIIDVCDDTPLTNPKSNLYEIIVQQVNELKELTFNFSMYDIYLIISSLPNYINYESVIIYVMMDHFNYHVYDDMLNRDSYMNYIQQIELLRRDIFNIDNDMFFTKQSKASIKELKDLRKYKVAHLCFLLQIINHHEF